ncbi:MAG: YbjN domain-containing protein [Oscillatoriaceae bacterium SKW80]|nr:YbjN domain-containing protein [Oscillatoriaceae bacterium SKYG93]MCX8120232.1 YbjN domain-containing protein [Oscillatoriaceae bacterium SKW80]MDW8453158.1 YbjN domain-containing protein [Oscillatoriaceae cyanobacterium SKYGB_i_bin93]HIK28930.1 YbjN domain-containing protein [Oscillatoriaceae cyanobacterium M7585_C2015_266]
MTIPETLSEPILSTTTTEDIETLDHVQEIEAVIGSLAVDQKVMVGHSDEGYLWKFKYGSVEVFVQLTGINDEDTLTVWSFVLPLPAKNEAQLFRKLLEMNWLTTFEARFGIVDDHVVILSTRTVAELSPGEISRAITIVATLADENDEALRAEFGESKLNNG